MTDVRFGGVSCGGLELGEVDLNALEEFFKEWAHNNTPGKKGFQPSSSFNPVDLRPKFPPRPEHPGYEPGVANDAARAQWSKDIHEYNFVTEPRVWEEARAKQAAWGRAGVGKLTDAEVESLTAWTTQAVFKPINSSLRTGRKPSSQTQARIEALDGVMSKSRLPTDIVLTRACHSDAFPDGFPPTVGAIHVDKGFLATSVDSMTFSANNKNPKNLPYVDMTIRAPRGTRGVHVNSVTRSKHDEGEVLLDRGTRLRILSVTPPKDPASFFEAWRIEAEVLP